MALVLDGSNDTITGLQINSSNIVDGSIVNADINSSAAIASSKLSGVSNNLVHISTTQITSDVATFTFSNSFNQYLSYKIIGINIRPEQDARDLYLRCQDSGGDLTSAHKSIVHGGGTEYTHNQNSEFRLNYNSIGNAYSGSHLEEMAFLELNLSGFAANHSFRYTGLISYSGSDTNARGQAIMGVCVRSEAIVGLKFFMDSGSIAGGSNYGSYFILYGVNNA
tara:strand:- start:175 stop:843 length:669 start_codon:yes stop_codon:yes gene_type:complete